MLQIVTSRGHVTLKRETARTACLQVRLYRGSRSSQDLNTILAVGSFRFKLINEAMHSFINHIRNGSETREEVLRLLDPRSTSALSVAATDWRTMRGYDQWTRT